MATSSTQSNTTLFDQIIFTIINDLKNKHKRADVESIHKEIAKKSDFKDVTKEELEERINILLIDEKLLNKISRNLNSYSVNTVNTEIDYETTQLISINSSIATPMNDATPRFHVATQTPLNDSETPITNRVSLGYLNINSVRNKFFSIPHLIDNNIDIFTIAETKLDSSFPDSQSLMPGMRKPFRPDVTSRKGGLLVFVNNDIPCKYLRNFHLPRDIQAIPIEINLKQRKLLAVSIYRPPDQNLDYFLSSITSLLDHYLTIYEDFVVMGDFSVNESNPVMETFLNQHNCKNIIKNKTCYKSLEVSCIDLIITSRPSLHQFSQVFETGVSDHHSMIYTML